MKNDKFVTALTFTLQWEGGYSNHPSDKGGPTMKGITTGVYNKFRRTKGLPLQSVKTITAHEIQEIYRLNYWDLIAGEELESPLALALFDYAVNSGPVRAVKVLQRIVKVTVDGKIGKITLGKVLDQNQGELARQILSEREHFLRSIVQNNPSQSVFLKGWMNRLAALSKSVEAA